MAAPHFPNVGGALKVNDFNVSGGAIMDDFDNDGLLDLVTTCLRSDTNMIDYHNNGDGTYTDWTERTGLIGQKGGLSVVQADHNNDGWMDFYLGTGAPAYEIFLPNMMFMNQGGTTFAEGTVASGLGHFQKGHGVSFGDADNDGDLDLLCQIGGRHIDDRYDNGLFRNDGPPAENHWLTIRLRGKQSDHFGAGASFGSNSLQTEPGRSKGQLLRLVIFWTTTGETQVPESPPMDSVIQVEEGASSWTVPPVKAIQLAPSLTITPD